MLNLRGSVVVRLVDDEVIIFEQRSLQIHLVPFLLEKTMDAAAIFGAKREVRISTCS